MTRWSISFSFLVAAVAGLVGALAPAAASESRRAADSNGNLQFLVSKHAAATGVPEQLIRRVIHRESRGNPRVVSKGNFGLMQIRLGTARAMGYSGSAQGLLDADTNMTYAVRYLAGALRAAGGNHDRAVAYYASGYYYAAKRKGLEPWAKNVTAARANAEAVAPAAAVVEASADADADVSEAPAPLAERDTSALH